MDLYFIGCPSLVVVRHCEPLSWGSFGMEVSVELSCLFGLLVLAARACRSWCRLALALLISFLLIDSIVRL